MASVSLIDLGSIGPGENTAIPQSRKFRDEWNKRFPDYPVFIKNNPHDFGTYPSIEISERLFEKSFNDFQFPATGIEQTAIDLADELKLDY